MVQETLVGGKAFGCTLCLSIGSTPRKLQRDVESNRPGEHNCSVRVVEYAGEARPSGEKSCIRLHWYRGCSC